MANDPHIDVGGTWALAGAVRRSARAVSRSIPGLPFAPVRRRGAAATGAAPATVVPWRTGLGPLVGAYLGRSHGDAAAAAAREGSVGSGPRTVEPAAATPLLWSAGLRHPSAVGHRSGSWRPSPAVAATMGARSAVGTHTTIVERRVVERAGAVSFPVELERPGHSEPSDPARVGRPPSIASNASAVLDDARPLPYVDRPNEAVALPWRSATAELDDRVEGSRASSAAPHASTRMPHAPSAPHPYAQAPAPRPAPPVVVVTGTAERGRAGGSPAPAPLPFGERVRIAARAGTPSPAAPDHARLDSDGAPPERASGARRAASSGERPLTEPLVPARGLTPLGGLGAPPGSLAPDRPTTTPARAAIGEPFAYSSGPIAATWGGLIGAVREAVAREVSARVAPAIERLERSSPSPAVEAPAPPPRAPTDQFVRQVMSRMRALANDERFRAGWIR